MEQRVMTQMLAEKYRRHLQEKERSKATVEKYMRDIAAFMLFAEGRKLSKELVLSYKDQICRQYKSRSVNSMLSSLNGLFSFLQWWELKAEHLKVQRRMFRSDEKELTRDEYKRLLDAAQRQSNERLYLMIQSICATGIRVSELQYITVEAVKAGVAEVHNKGKLRTILIPSLLCKKLIRYVEAQGISSGAVFVTAGGKPIHRANIWRDMKKLCESAKVSPEKVFPHNLRHLFAITFYSLEKDIVKLADILGHAKTETTRIYTISSASDQVKRIDRLGLIL